VVSIRSEFDWKTQRKRKPKRKNKLKGNANYAIVEGRCAYEIDGQRE
jgi:hypothetical protein